MVMPGSFHFTISPEIWSIVGKVAAGLITTLATGLGVLSSWRKLSHEGKIESKRIYIPTSTEEIVKYSRKTGFLVVLLFLGLGYGFSLGLAFHGTNTFPWLFVGTLALEFGCMVVVTNAMVKIKKLNVMLMAGNAMHLVLIIGGSIVITSLAQMQDIREIYSLQFMPKEPIPSKNAAASSLVNRIGGISLAKTLNHVTNSSTYMKKQPFPKEGVLPNNLGRAGVNNETQSSPAFKMENITNETRKLGAFDTSAVQSASNTSDQTAPHATSAKLLNQARSVRFQESSSTNLEIISKPTAQYTPEARKDKIQGDVVLRVTFRADGHVLVLEVVRGLGYGLDEEARRIAEQIRFRPATRDGKAIDVTTTIIITFQLA